MGVTQRKLAELLSVHRSLISKIETGESGFDCFSHYFERTYFDAVKQGYSEVMRIAATRIKHRPKLDFEKARMPMVEVR